ncbi:hypothetical protein H634G_02207 [Metarhizium anisopliae BRIP 53293]|uniref:Uncharacterized protein n=1 Tax=Metarhizium anisopliae BRIP 53293 TaxID=1291518 RepID=A0A0D9P944_METAN|nr:hypothetical protein H634G_02207 [Metarhizium anisopliae BRIP 53293]KJK89499.1 hypothetical protein H633G_06657 [Metarhizium anisopliae BRIP 53284]
MSGCLSVLERWAAEIELCGAEEVTLQALANSLKVAEGTLNIVIVMIEPCNNHATVDYETMVARSPSLQEVDRLIRKYGTNRGIAAVPILVVRPLISKAMGTAIGNRWPTWEERAYEVFEDILRHKKPDVILSLQRVTKDANSLLCKSLSDQDWSPLPDIVRLANRTAILFRAFHPSSYLRPDYTANKTTAWVNSMENKLDASFKAAFMALNGHQLLRWNTEVSPWQYHCMLAAERRQEDRSYARRITPSELYCTLQFHNNPETRLALLHEIDIQFKLEELAGTVLPVCKEDTTPQEVVELLNSLSI